MVLVCFWRPLRPTVAVLCFTVKDGDGAAGVEASSCGVVPPTYPAFVGKTSEKLDPLEMLFQCDFSMCWSIRSSSEFQLKHKRLHI